MLHGGNFKKTVFSGGLCLLMEVEASLGLVSLSTNI